MNNESVIIFENVSFSYNGRPALIDVNIHFNHLDFISVVGPNGGGKTTMLKLILGLLKPDKGRIRVCGESPENARKSIGYVPQHFHFDPKFPIRVRDVVLMGRLNIGKSWGSFGKKDQQAVDKSMNEVEIIDLANRSFAELSGGQRQRVLIARALATNAGILLLDEPTAHVDPGVQDEIYNLLQNLNERITIVMVTHDAGFVAPFIKSVVCVNQKVVMHPTHAVTGEIISELYGGQVRYVSHSDVTCPHTEDCERCARLQKTIDNIQRGDRKEKSSND
ncbi:MAG: metal ABC transporter ATP-binding protein [Candidatus Zixiibacteriota bacterium]